MCKINFTMERETKNTVRFTEVLGGKLTSPVIGTIYIQKETLKAMDWKEGMDIALSVGIAEEAHEEGVLTAAAKAQAATAKYKEEKQKAKKARKSAPAKKAPAKKASKKTKK